MVLMENKIVTYIVKTSLDCNMRCAYCYEGDRMNGSYMSEDTLRMFISNVGEYSKETNSRAYFIWHGGEPLLAGKDFYQLVVDQQKAVGKGFEYVNSIQTNGVLLDDEYADFFIDNKFAVGVSLDGPRIIHDAQRFGATGKKGTFDEVYAALVKMDDRGTRPGALAVFTRNTLNHLDEFYDFFRDRSMSVKINPLIYDGRAKSALANDLQVTPKEYGDALIHLFDRWVQEPEFNFTINPLMNIVQSITSGRVTQCSHGGQCYNYFKVFPEGDIHMCGMTPYSEHVLGNINEMPFSDIYKSPEREKYIQIKSSMKEICGKCDYYNICHGGCTNSAYTRHGTLQARDHWCESNKKIFGHIKETIIDTGLVKACARHVASDPSSSRCNL